MLEGPKTSLDVVGGAPCRGPLATSRGLYGASGLLLCTFFLSLGLYLSIKTRPTEISDPFKFVKLPKS
jgi:hypothetical protein